MDQEIYNNIEWTDTNLPWHYHSSWEDAPQPPDLQDQEREIFGASLEDAQKNIEPHLEAYRNLQDELRELQGDTESDDLYNKIEEEFWAKHAQDSCVLAREEYFALREKINHWAMEQPVWKAHAKAVEEFSAQEKQKSFSGRGLARPGTLIEMEDGSIEFIGSINSAGGCCNDCPAFEDTLIVKRYALVYPFTKREANDDYYADK